MAKLTKKDIFRYILKIQLNFENAYRFDSDEERLLLIESWMDIFGGYPKEVCDAAVNNALSHAKFAPRMGDITEEIQIILNGNKKTDAELWAEITDLKYEIYDKSRYLKYPQHFDRYYGELNRIYDSLDDELKLYFVNLQSVIDFSELTKEEMSYEKNRFFKNMPLLRKHSAEKIKSEQFCQLLEQQKLKLKNNNDDN